MTATLAEDLFRERHTTVYNALASEYEQRVAHTQSNVGAIVDRIAPYMPQASTVLDVGCAVGLAAHLFAQRSFRVTGIDIAPNMLVFAQERNPRATFVLGDFVTLDVDTRFDCVFLLAFIHLFPKTVAVDILRKAHAILRPGGVAFVGTTRARASTEGWEVKTDYHGRQKRFRKHWTQEELEEAFVHTNFEILNCTINTDWIGKQWMEYIVRRGV